jgi:hypothetical protein
LNKHNYCVPKEYIGKRVDLIYDAENINIYYGLKLVTIHQRDDTPYTYTQKEAHGLPGHHGSYEKDLEEIYQRAGEIDNILLLYLKDVAGQAKYPPKAFRSCRGIMSLEKKYGLDRLVAACACATEGLLYGYNEVREILERGEDAVFLPPDEEGTKVAREPQRHKNIRGREYYLQKPQPPNITSDKDNGNTKCRTAPIVHEKERNQVTLELMRRMRLTGMANAFMESLSATYAEAMTPDAFISWLLAREWDYRSAAAIERLVKGAGFRYKAYPEEIDYRISRGLNQN